jgi:hypothetical protein
MEILSPKMQEKLVKRLFHNDRIRKDHGNILIHVCSARGTDYIINVHLMDVDTKSQRSKDLNKVLAVHEREKKNKYLDACLEQCRYFSPFVVVNGRSTWQGIKHVVEETLGSLC